MILLVLVFFVATSGAWAGERTFDCQVAYQGANGKTVGGAKKSATTAGSADQADVRLSDERYEYHVEIVGQTFQIDVVEKAHRTRQDVCIKGGSGPYISYQFPVTWAPAQGPAKGLKLASIELYCTQR